MIRITRDPSSGSFTQCLAKITVMVLSCPLTWTFLVLSEHICPWCVCVLHSLEMHSRLCSTHTVPLYTVQYTHSASPNCAVHTQCLSTLCSTHTVPLQTVQYTHSASLDSAVYTHTHHRHMCCHNTDYVHINGHDRTITVILAKHCVKLPDDGSFVIRNMLEQF